MKQSHKISPDIQHAHNRVAGEYGICGIHDELPSNSYNYWNLHRNVVRPLTAVFTKYLKTGALFLDAGCGNGQISQILCSIDSLNIIGIDFCQNMLRHAIIRAKHHDYSHHFTCIRADLESLDMIRQNTFDAALLFGVIEHLDDPGHVIANILQTLKPDGIFILGVPRKWSFSYFSYLLFGRSPRRWGNTTTWMDYFSYREKLTYYRFYTPHQIEDYLAPNGVEILDKYPFGYLHLDGFPGRICHFLGRYPTIGHVILDRTEKILKRIRWIPGGEFWVIRKPGTSH